MPRFDPNDDGVNESQPPGSIPDFEDEDEFDLPLGDLGPGVAEANLALLGKSDPLDFAEEEIP